MESPIQDHTPFQDLSIIQEVLDESFLTDPSLLHGEQIDDDSSTEAVGDLSIQKACSGSLERSGDESDGDDDASLPPHFEDNHDSDADGHSTVARAHPLARIVALSVGESSFSQPPNLDELADAVNQLHRQKDGSLLRRIEELELKEEEREERITTLEARCSDMERTCAQLLSQITQKHEAVGGEVSGTAFVPQATTKSLFPFSDGSRRNFPCWEEAFAKRKPRRSSARDGSRSAIVISDDEATDDERLDQSIDMMCELNDQNDFGLGLAAIQHDNMQSPAPGSAMYRRMEAGKGRQVRRSAAEAEEAAQAEAYFQDEEALRALKTPAKDADRSAQCLTSSDEDDRDSNVEAHRRRRVSEDPGSNIMARYLAGRIIAHDTHSSDEDEPEKGTPSINDVSFSNHTRSRTAAVARRRHVGADRSKSTPRRSTIFASPAVDKSRNTPSSTPSEPRRVHWPDQQAGLASSQRPPRTPCTPALRSSMKSGNGVAGASPLTRTEDFDSVPDHELFSPNLSPIRGHEEIENENRVLPDSPDRSNRAEAKENDTTNKSSALESVSQSRAKEPLDVASHANTHVRIGEEFVEEERSVVKSLFLDRPYSSSFLRSGKENMHSSSSFGASPFSIPLEDEEYSLSSLGGFRSTSMSWRSSIFSYDDTVTTAPAWATLDVGERLETVAAEQRSSYGDEWNTRKAREGSEFKSSNSSTNIPAHWRDKYAKKSIR